MFRAAALYIVAAWVAVQVAGLLFPAIDVPEASLRYVWLIVVSLFPLVIVFAWRFDISLDGIRRTPPAARDDGFDPSLKRLDVVLLAALAAIAVSVTMQFGVRIEPGQTRLDDSISPFSIAVLPFDDLSGSTDEQYFVSGMQSSLIDGLSRVRNLRVTSKVSTLPYREAGGSLLDIAMQLGVARIVEGTVLRNGNRVSIALRMHDAEADTQVWSARFEDDLENIFVLQAQAAQEIANQVRVQLGPEEREQFEAASAVNAEAFLAYLKGVFHVERYNPEDMRIAATHFERAVDLDPEFALGYWGLSKLCGFQAQAGVITPAEARETCIPLALQALDFDPFLPEAHMGLAAHTTWQQFDWDAALPHWQRALELNPSYAEAHMFYSHYLGIVGRLDDSTVHIERAVSLDPHNPFVIGLYAIQLVMRDEYNKAIEAAEQALSMAPGYAFGYSPLVLAHTYLGNESEAVEAMSNMLRIIGEYAEAADLLETAYERDGYEAAHLQLAEHFVSESKRRHVPASIIALAYEFGGDYESALDWMETAVDDFDPDAPYFGVNVKNTELRENPRYPALLRRLSLDYWADAR